MRKYAFLLTLLAGVALTLAGFFLSATIGPPTGPEYSNPKVQFAPAMFVLGVVLMFMSAVVYELVDGRR